MNKTINLLKKTKKLSEKQISRVKKMPKEKQQAFVKKQVEKMNPEQVSEAKSYFVYWWKKLGLWK